MTKEEFFINIEKTGNGVMVNPDSINLQFNYGAGIHASCPVLKLTGCGVMVSINALGAFGPSSNLGIPTKYSVRMKE